ncbi:unnamed protein product [Adineta steineri]|uniref:Uncharacterized protein n=1 Tax=Adineta steineri TaxID=433720 RepID=A0A815PT50_9BILA|nr:unnamed protein product [Adineta steineri]CAF1453154.1 unnamed protein product [Adineta steineri]
MPSLRTYFLNLNLFAPSLDSNEQETDQQRRWNIISTRVYIVLTILILIVVGLILSLLKQSTMITLKNPTKEQFELLPNHAKCSCSHTTIPYNKFVSMEPRFHQICSSDFVTDRWINAMDSGTNTTYFHFEDFRRYGSAQFQALAGFCRLSKSSTNQSITFFTQNTLLSPKVLLEDTFRSHIHATIEQFKLTAPNTFKSQLSLINQITINSEFMSALQTNNYYALDMYFIGYFGTVYKQTENFECQCALDVCNNITSGFFTNFGTFSPEESETLNLAWLIPGMLSGCLPVPSLLLSTLECFYDQDCVNRLISYFPITEKFQAMTKNHQSVFKLESPIESIVEKLMIENWTITISYPNYYVGCAPSLCTYFKISRNGFVYALKKVISILSTLTLILGLIIPAVIRFIVQSRDRTPKPHISFRIRLHQLKQAIKKKLIELNIFQHYPSTDRQIHFQRYATRLFIFLLIVSTVIFSIYIFLEKSIQSKIILNPTESQFIQLEREYRRSISCPCSSISILYSNFTDIQPQYHQLYFSDLLSDRWIKYIRDAITIHYLDYNDYRVIGQLHFKSLQMLFKLAKETIDNALEVFFTTEFISLQVISNQSFHIQINSFIEDWKLTTVNTFKTTIQIIDQANQGNQLISSTLNARDELDSYRKTVLLHPETRVGCNCIVSSSCHKISDIFRLYGDMSGSRVLYSIPNFFIGCYLLESLSVSTLECFYNLSCMLLIHEHLYSSETFNFSALNPDLNLYNETIGMIVDRAMVDKWLVNISFSSYYENCAPLSCTYQYEHRNNLFNIIISIASVFGGLSLGFQLLLSVGLQFINKIMINSCFRLISLNSFKQLFICNTENQIIRRFHIILVIGSVSILYIFTAFTARTITVEVKKPSLEIYKDLLKQSYDSLECPCSQMSIKYKAFLSITAHFHEVCSSNFISNEWILYLYEKRFSNNESSADDFYHSAVGQFKLLSSFCTLSKETVNNSIIQLIASDFINSQLLSPDVLNVQILTIINQFQLTMPQIFINSLLLIREITQANMILSVFLTNWMFEPVHNLPTDTQVIPHTIPIHYNGCSCSLSSKCVSSSRGMLAGCYPLESILQSTFQCLYNQQCIDSTKTFKSINNSSLSTSRFSLSQTIESIINELMIEELSHNLTYEIYYNECSPSVCIYSYVDKHNTLEGMTALLGLYSGLVIICRIIAILTVKKMFGAGRRVAPTTN